MLSSELAYSMPKGLKIFPAFLSFPVGQAQTAFYGFANQDYNFNTDILRNLVATRASNEYGTRLPVISTLGASLGAGNKWAGGLLGLDGKIYGIPFAATTSLVIDPATNTVTTVGSFSATTNKYVGGCLHPNNKMYWMPNGATGIVEFDYLNKTSSTFSSATGYNYCAVGVDNAIYSAAAAILRIDPYSRSVATFGSSGSVGVCSITAHPNGKLYAFSSDAASSWAPALEIDPVNKTVISFGNATTVANAIFGLILAPNGNIYGIAAAGTQCVEINPYLKQLTFFGSLGSSGVIKWQGGCLAPNGKIYGATRSTTTGLEIDPIAKTATTFGSLVNTTKIGLVLATNNKAYLLPFAYTDVYQFDFSYLNSFDTSVYPSIYFNKL